MNRCSFTSRDGRNRAGRRGFTILELAVAIGLLAILMTTCVQMLRLVSRQQQAAERRAVALQTVQGVAELVGNIPWDELTPAALDQIAIPDGVKPYLPSGRLNIAMADEADPVARRISIELRSSGPAGQPAGTTRLTTWVFPDQSLTPEL